MADTCPLCIDDITEEEKDFRPCKCGFVICVWCFHTLVMHADDEKAKCPHCRRTYPKTVMSMRPPQRERRKKDPNRSDHPLADVRMRSPTALCVTGLPDGLTEGTLRQHYMFGQYGRIAEIRVRKSRSLTAAFLEYSHPSEVEAAIACVDGLVFHGNELSASQGITKYCATFLAGGSVCAKEYCADVHYTVPEVFYYKGQGAPGTPIQSMMQRETSTPSLGPPVWPKGVLREHTLPSVAEYRSQH